MAYKIYIWQYIEEDLTDNWHSGGGLAIITDRMPKVALIDDLVNNGSQYNFEALAPKYEKLELPEPDFITDVDAVEEKVFIFADAGCC